MKKIYLVSLGCPKNLVDTEYMAGMLCSNGFEVTGNPEDASFVLINTCAFIESAVRESVETILEFASLKEEKGFELVVAGCLVQRYGYKLRREIPEVDIWLGTGKVGNINDILKKKKGFFISSPGFIPERYIPRIQSTPPYTAYLKIAEGCSHRCSFCIIPKLRGKAKSIKPEFLIREAKKLAENGVKELNIVAQDITTYGKDIDLSLEDLLEELLKIKGIEWIRLLYLYPKGISERLLKLIENEEKICPYLDVPIQHVNDEILMLMERGYDKRFLMKTIEKIKALKRKIYLRTTLMVGFPKETEERFKELYEFVKEVEFDHLGVFVFSPEKGTKAYRLKPKVEKKEAEMRRDEIMKLQADISERKNKEMIGKKVSVIIEGAHPETDLLLVGRTQWMAPEIDSQVIINKGLGDIGEIVSVKITEAYPYDLIGEIV